MVRIVNTAAALLLLSAAALGARPLLGRDVPTDTPVTRSEWNIAQGDVIITASPNGRDVIVAFDANDAGSADGISDRVFLLQRSRDLDAALPRLMSAISLDGASLRFDAGTLQVFHPQFSASLSVEKKGYGVPAVDGEKLPQLTTEPTLGEFQAVFTGYGLQRSTGRWNMTADDLRAGAAAGFGCNTGSAATGSPLSGTPVTAFACAAGGVGSTQCSLDVGGGCSVSCGTGFYACCNLLGGCKCTALKINVPG